MSDSARGKHAAALILVGFVLMEFDELEKEDEMDRRRDEGSRDDRHVREEYQNVEARQDKRASRRQ